jgi:hypothetical protein
VQGHAAGMRQALAGHGIRAGEHRWSPGYRGHPPRSYLASVERGNPDGVRRRVGGGKPTVRKAQLPGREQDDPRSECRWPKGDRKPRPRPDPPIRGLRITGRIPGRVPGCESRLTRVR